MPVNGFQTISHEQLQSALQQEIRYTMNVNGALYFFDDVTEQDMDAIAAVYCNGIISAPGRARGSLDSKAKHINGTIIDIDALIKKEYGGDVSHGDDPIGCIKKMMRLVNGGGYDNTAGNRVNSGTFKM